MNFSQQTNYEPKWHVYNKSTTKMVARLKITMHQVHIATLMPLSNEDALNNVELVTLHVQPFNTTITKKNLFPPSPERQECKGSNS